MPAKSPANPAIVTEQLAALGARIRAQRKALRVSATALAEAAGMSRVSVHRIEQGEPSVTMGAYLNVLAALGMTFSATGAFAKSSGLAGALHAGDGDQPAQGGAMEQNPGATARAGLRLKTGITGPDSTCCGQHQKVPKTEAAGQTDR